MKYQIHILQTAEKEMGKLSVEIHDRISNKLLSLENNPRPKGVKKLSTQEQYRLRVGNYRVLYTVDDSTEVVTIVSVGHRREVYR